MENTRSDDVAAVDEGDTISSMWTDRFAPDTIVSAVASSRLRLTAVS